MDMKREGYDMNRYAFSWPRFEALPLVGILRGFAADLVPEIVRAALDAGLATIEVTMNTPGAATMIRNLVQTFGAEANIGAGTVTDARALDGAVQAGASFVVTPVVLPAVIQRCRQEGVPIFSGALTPTEIFQAWQAGADMVKVFPADAFGPAYVRAVRAPLNQVKLLPTGGITPENVRSYRDAGASGYGIGGPLFDRARMEARDWPWLRAQVARFQTALTP